MVLGERLAGIALLKIYGKSTGFEAPDLIEAGKIDKSTVCLKFNNISNRLYVFEVSADQLPFLIEDEDGEAQIKGYEINEANVLIISLDRELKGKCLVHGAFERNPKQFIPVDFASHLPMLSFYGVDIL